MRWRSLISFKVWQNKFYAIVFKLDWTICNKLCVKRWCKNHLGLDIDYRHPANDIRVKASWLNACDKNYLRALCADKYKVREYVRKKNLSHILVPLIGVYKSANEIDFEKLPNQFVLKCNHGSGMNIIVIDKSKCDYNKIRGQLDTWLKVNYSEYACECHYRRIKRLIVCEVLLSKTAPTEYQCWCINGEVDSLLCCRKNFDGTYDSYSYSTDWVQLYERKGEKSNIWGGVKRPSQLDVIINYAKILSQDFPFVRADFYEVEGIVYFAELTFTPDTNAFHMYNDEFCYRLGEKLILMV